MTNEAAERVRDDIEEWLASAKWRGRIHWTDREMAVYLTDLVRPALAAERRAMLIQIREGFHALSRGPGKGPEPWTLSEIDDYLDSVGGVDRDAEAAR